MHATEMCTHVLGVMDTVITKTLRTFRKSRGIHYWNQNSSIALRIFLTGKADFEKGEQFLKCVIFF